MAAANGVIFRLGNRIYFLAALAAANARKGIKRTFSDFLAALAAANY
ncbi:hypothetical protein THIOSC15_1150004 [uncultured Thiomicrorhabdus sp.]